MNPAYLIKGKRYYLKDFNSYNSKTLTITHFQKGPVLMVEFVRSVSIYTLINPRRKWPEVFYHIQALKADTKYVFKALKENSCYIYVRLTKWQIECMVEELIDHLEVNDVQALYAI
jgi:hypothetical protein